MKNKEKQNILNEINRNLSTKSISFLLFIRDFLKKDVKRNHLFLFIAKDKYDVANYKQFLKINKLKYQAKKLFFSKSNLDFEKFSEIEQDFAQIDKLLKEVEKKLNEL